MNITYKRINKEAGNYEVFMDEKNVGVLVGKAKKWELKNLFGTSISKGITRDIAVKDALDNHWEYESEFELFHNAEDNQEENLEDSFIEANEEIETIETIETIKTIEENKFIDSEPKLGDDYQPMGKPTDNKIVRFFDNTLSKIKKYANKICV